MSSVESLRPKSVLQARARELERLLRRQDMTIETVADPLDEIQLAVERELAIENADRVSATLASIRTALQRIEDGTYGICEDCDEDIAQKRLAAVPWALRCVKCQEAFENSGISREELDLEEDEPRKRRGLRDAA